MRYDTYRQYDRKYRLIVDSKQAGVAFDVSDLRITFKVEKKAKGTGNNAQISVYNVSEDSIAAIQDGDRVFLEAGYKNGNYGLIYSGNIVQAFLNKGDDVDSAMTLMCQDADVFLTKKVISATVGAGATQSEILNKCLEGSEDVSRGTVSDSLNEKLLPRGKVLFGRPVDYVEQIARSNQAQLFIDNGTINIVASDEYDANTAVELNPETGLIGTPEQMKSGVKAKCLINSSLRINTLVHIDKAYINALVNTKGNAKKNKEMNANGVYKVIKLTYSGDTRENDWYCEFEADTVSGRFVSTLADGVTNEWR